LQAACEAPPPPPVPAASSTDLATVATPPLPPPIIPAASSTDPATVAMPPLQRFRAARELLLAAGPRRGGRSGEKGRPLKGRRRRAAPAQLSIPGAQLEHLMCFISTSRLQGELTEIDFAHSLQDTQVEDLRRTRDEEVLRLSVEAATLWGGPGEDLLLGGGSREVRQAREVEEGPCRASARLDALKRQVASQDAAVAAAQRGTLEAEHEVALLEARLEALASPGQARQAASLELRRRCEELLRGPGRQLLAALQRPPPLEASADGAVVSMCDDPLVVARGLGALAVAFESLAVAAATTSAASEGAAPPPAEAPVR